MRGWKLYLTRGEYKRLEFSAISVRCRGELTSPLERVGFYSGIELQTSGRILYASDGGAIAFTGTRRMDFMVLCTFNKLIPVDPFIYLSRWVNKG